VAPTRSCKNVLVEQKSFDLNNKDFHVSTNTVIDINFFLLVANLIFTYTLHALNISTVYKEKNE